METLLAYAAGELGADERAEVEARLRHDASARATLKLYQRAQHALANDDSMAPPAATIARAKAIHASSRRDSKANWLERAQQLVARLVFDSRTQPAPAGMRSSHQSCALMFETENESIDLQAEPTRNTDGRITAWQLVGQVEQEGEPEGCPVAIIDLLDERSVAAASLDERGMFALTLSPGTYEIRIALPTHTFVVPQLDLT